MGKGDSPGRDQDEEQYGALVTYVGLSALPLLTCSLFPLPLLSNLFYFLGWEVEGGSNSHKA